jgi:hypothetical protein
MLNVPPDSAQRGSRQLLEALTPHALKELMPQPVRRGVKTIYVPAVSALQLLANKPRSSYSWSAPRASEVVANYTRGLVLFGRSDARRAIFEWRSFPTRAVIARDTAKIPRALRPVRRRGDLEVRFDQDFEAITMLGRWRLGRSSMMYAVTDAGRPSTAGRCCLILGFMVPGKSLKSSSADSYGIL